MARPTDLAWEQNVEPTELGASLPVRPPARARKDLATRSTTDGWTLSKSSAQLAGTGLFRLRYTTTWREGNGIYHAHLSSTVSAADYIPLFYLSIFSSFVDFFFSLTLPYPFYCVWLFELFLILWLCLDSECPSPSHLVFDFVVLGALTTESISNSNEAKPIGLGVPWWRNTHTHTPFLFCFCFACKSLISSENAHMLN